MTRFRRILVTGGTGSFGSALIRKLLSENLAQEIVVYSRDELKQLEMRESLKEDPRMRYFLGDVRDKDRLRRAFKDVEIVIHAAALKQVDSGEYNPTEFIKTNVYGSSNVVEAALDAEVSKIVALSTDKASSPINLYGASKLAADKLFLAANSYRGNSSINFSVVRYGNVIGSRGSIIPIFMKLKAEGKSLPITDVRMTRFWITIKEAVDFVLESIHQMQGGELFVPKIPSMRIMDLVQAIAPDHPFHITGIRPGEKLHEEMISIGESYRTFESTDRYIIYSSLLGNFEGKFNQKKVPEGFNYRSDNNQRWLSVQDLQDRINNKNE